MSVTLILIRHAKSDWGDPMQSDKARPLNKRGRRDAPRMAAWLKDQGIRPDAALVSTAERTAETWGLLSEGWGAPDIPVEFVDKLYHAEASVILDCLQNATASCVALVGHNPGIADAAHRLLASPPNHLRFMDYPTCATLVCRFDVESWADLYWGTGDVAAFATPHDL